MNEGYGEALKRIQEAKEKNLTELDLSDLGLKEIPKELFELKNLIKLDLSNLYLEELPRELFEFKSLKCLVLHDNQNLIFSKDIKKLSNLEVLTISNLKEFPEEILELKKLKTLAITDSFIIQVPKEIDRLTELEEIYFDNCDLKYLPKSLYNLKNLEFLQSYNNLALNIPDEILDDIENPKKILDYYFNLQKSKKRELSEAKVLFVGQGSVGKSSLIKALQNEQFDENRLMTTGIEIDKIVSNDITLNFWDFGGQEIMHSTHQFFLTKRSLYILVLNARENDELKRTDYWLKLISSFGVDSPVIIVLNKVDDGNLGIDENRLKRKYPQIKRVLSTSCKDNIGIDELREAIYQESEKLEHVKEVWIENWFEIKEILEQKKDAGMDFISFLEFEKLCRDRDIDSNAQKILIEYLHDLGIVLNFQEKSLKSTNVLNPRWITDGVYKIINSKAILDGVLTREILEQIFTNEDKYPKDKLNFIIEMMRKFELLFDFNGNYLIPELLAKSEPELSFDFEKNLCFIYEYDYLPTSVISRFITRSHRAILNSFFWKNGVVLEHKKIKALILADEFDKTISIFIDSKEKQEFLTMIRHQLNDINQSLSSLKITQRVIKDRSRVSLRHLLMLEQKKIETFLPENSENIISVKELLDEVINPKERAKEINDILKSTHKSIEKEGLKDILESEYLIRESSEDIFKLKEQKSMPFAIKQFKIKNYQSIREASVTIPLDSKWVFITGYNGAGKSAILQALSFGLMGISNDKINENFKVAIELQAGEEIKINNIINLGNYWNRPELELTNFISYGASRLLISEDDKSDNNHLFESDSKLANIERWLKDKKLEIEEDRENKKIFDRAIDLLTELLPDIDKIEIKGSRVIYCEKGESVKLNELSHGHKSIVAMVGDLILKLFDIEPNIKEFSDFKAIVFIDEFETHLHPIWQIEFIDKLSKFFLNIQFWTTTHSPLPFIKAPEGSTILKVDRDEQNGTTIKNLDIDISNLSPDIILTSPFFDVEVLVNSDAEDIRSERDYLELLKNDDIDSLIKDKLKNLNLDNSFLQELKDED